MLGEYIGQFLPISGGTLTGNLGLAGNSIDFDSSSKITADGSGNVTVSANSFVFALSNFTAAQLIYVDGTNGSDATGNGTSSGPYATIGKAASVATSGQCIFVLPGTYNLTTQIVLPAGVSLSGCGIGVTVLQNAGFLGSARGQPSPFIVLGTGSTIQDVQILGVVTSSPTTSVYPIGFNTLAGPGGSNQTSTSFTLRRVDVTGRIDGLYCSGAQPTVLFEDVWLRSNYDVCVFQTGVTGTFNRVHFLPTYASGVSNILTCLKTGNNVASNVTCDDCEFNITDTISTSISAQAYYFLLDASTAGGNLFAECKNCRFIQNTPGVPQAFIGGGGSSYHGSGWPTTSSGGNSLKAILSGGASVIAVPETPVAATVSSNAITPALAAYNQAATDAGSLSSNTLTVNAIAWNTLTAKPADGIKSRLRIKNTNSGSTAMTLSFNGAYNNAAFAIGTIAAGKRAYFDFVYDADNSRWDLTGYVNGL
jgi:hypothetical protein